MRRISAFVLTTTALAVTGSTWVHMAPGASADTVALYLTDYISDYQQVTATVNKVQLLKAGSTTTCVILADPVTGI